MSRLCPFFAPAICPSTAWCDLATPTSAFCASSKRPIPALAPARLSQSPALLCFFFTQAVLVLQQPAGVYGLGIQRT
eukprot:2997948-Prymnesium_polylepis.1